MKKKDFIKAIHTVMESVEASTHRDSVFVCNSLTEFPKMKKDFVSVFGINHRIYDEDIILIPTCFGFLPDEECKQARLNALAMYLAQSLAFETYKEL